ncbi:MAG: DUF4139 domain-containing protein [Pseudomonadota bacterium]
MSAAARLIRRRLSRDARVALIALMAAASPLAVQTALADVIETTSQVASATVYPRGAAIIRAASFSAPAGSHEIVVDNLPVDLDADSLRVSGATRAGRGGAFSILGVAYNIRRPRAEPVSTPERQELLDRLEDLEWEQRAGEAAVAAAQARVDYIDAFRRATVGAPPQPPRRGPRTPSGGPEAGAQSGGAALFSQIDNWAIGWEILAAESGNARQAVLATERRLEGVVEEIDRVRDALDQTGAAPPPRSVLTLSIVADEAVDEGVLQIEYLTRQAQWAPLYDLKLQSAPSETPGLTAALTIDSRASVTQTTGEDWDGVRLSLSTARPTGRVAAPETRGRQVLLRPIRKATVGRERFRDLAESALETEPAPPPPAPVMAPRAGAGLLARAEDAVADEAAALASVTGTTVVFEIAEPARIPGDGERRQVLIGTSTEETQLIARATPALETTAYLHALHTPGAAPLLPGRASLYRDGVFYGQHRLSFTAVGQEVALPFGPLDDLSVAHRVVNRSQGEEGGVFTAATNREQSRFEFELNNRGAVERRVTLFDALPFTETEDIEVTRTGERPTAFNVDGKRGVVSWTLTLEPGETRRLPFGFDLSWPEGREIMTRPQ